VAATFLRAVRPLLTPRLTALIARYDEATTARWTIAADGPRADEVMGHQAAAEAHLRRLECREALILPETREGGETWEAIASSGWHERGTRFFCSLPLVSHGRVVGWFEVSGRQPRDLDAERIELLRELSRLVAGPLHVALLVSEARAQQERDALVNRVVQRVGASPDLDEVIGATLEEIGRAFGTSRVVVWLGEAEADIRLAYEWNAEGVLPIGDAVPIGSVVSPTAVRLGRTVAIADARADPLLAAEALGGREAYARAGILATLATPLSLAGRLLGILALHQLDRPRAWPDADRRQIEAVARELAVAVANTALLRERQRQAERLLALHQVSTAIASHKRAYDVMQEALQHSATLVGADSGLIYRWDMEAGLLRCLYAFGLPERLSPPSWRPGEGTVGQVFASRAPLIVNDYQTSDQALPAFQQAGLRAVVAAPLRRASEVTGVLLVSSFTAPTRFAEDDARLIEQFAAQVAVALENAELYRHLEQRLERIRTLDRLNRLISSSLDLDELLAEIARAAAALTGAVVASFWLADEAARTLELRAFSDEALGADQTFRRTTYGRGAAGWVARHRRPVVSDDVFADRKTRGLAWWRRHGLRTALTLPIVQDDALLAVLSLNGRAPFRVGPDEQAMLDSFVTQAAVAIRNASLYAASKRAEREVAEALAAQREANRQLEQLNKAKSDFVSVISHEFRTPLTGIQGFSELMRDEEFGLEEMKSFAAEINREAERLNRMISELLDLDRMESGRMVLHPETVDLNAVVTQTVEGARPTAPGHELRLELDPGLPPLPADRDKLTQVVVNLLSNAIKYSPDGGEVAVGTRRAGAEAHLWVRDRGVGIPPAALEVIFERYTRVEGGSHRYIKGTGLGLPIVREIARLHGGRAWAESEVGRGSVFHLALPLAGPPAEG
jgi:signal transduction histidine kinase